MATLKSTSKTVTQTQFDTASEAMQNIWLSKGFEIIADDAEPSDLLTPTTKETPMAKNDFSIQDERIWMNISMEIGGQTLRLPSVEITSIYYAQRKAKGEDNRIDVNEVMSLVKTINAHGTDAVNAATNVTVNFGKQGEKQSEAVDLLAAK